MFDSISKAFGTVTDAVKSLDYKKLYDKGVSYLGDAWDKGLETGKDLAKTEIGKLVSADFGKDTSLSEIGKGLLGFAKDKGSQVFDTAGTKPITDYLIGKITGKDVHFSQVTDHYKDITKAVFNNDLVKAQAIAENRPSLFEKSSAGGQAGGVLRVLPQSAENEQAVSLTPEDRQRLMEITTLALADGKLTPKETRELHRAIYSNKQDPAVQLGRSAAAEAYYNHRASKSHVMVA